MAACSVGWAHATPPKAGRPVPVIPLLTPAFRLVVTLCARFPLSLRNVVDLLFERGIDVCHETARLWWNRFGPLFAADIRRQQAGRIRGATVALACR